MGTRRSAEYVLGGSGAERARLRVQADEHQASARWLPDTIGIRRPGARVLDVGCGPHGILALLAEAVGPAGEVVGLEREPRFVEMARAEMAHRGLGYVTVIEGDALSSGLDRESFDIVHERLVIVNVPSGANC